MAKTEQKNEATVKVSARLPESLHQRAKIFSVQQQKSVDSIVREALEAFLNAAGARKVRVG